MVQWLAELNRLAVEVENYLIPAHPVWAGTKDETVATFFRGFEKLSVFSLLEKRRGFFVVEGKNLLW